MSYLFPSFAILFFILLVLKLTHVITWSWWLITTPLTWAITIALILIIHWANGDKP